MFFFFFSSRRRHTRCALVTGVQTCALPIFTALNSRFTYIPVGFEGRSAVGNTALGSALLANAGQQNTEPGPGATEGLVFGDRFPLSIGNERQNLSLSTRGDITDWLAVYASGSYSRYQVSSLVSSLPSLMRTSYGVFCLTKKTDK